MFSNNKTYDNQKCAVAFWNHSTLNLDFDLK